jgi:phosphatidylglycerophosphatase C
MRQRQIAFFDLDGTITEKDTLFEFVKEFVSPITFKFNLLLLIPLLLLAKLNLLESGRVKALFIYLCLRKIEKKQILTKAREFSLYKLPLLARSSMLNRLEWHKANGHEIVIVSASINFWIEPWASKNGYALICSEMKFESERITPFLKGKNCKGIEKLRRVKDAYDFKNYGYIYAYGNEESDNYLLAIANESFNNVFNFKK